MKSAIANPRASQLAICGLLILLALATAAIAAGRSGGSRVESLRDSRVPVGEWSGTATDDKYGDTGAVEFKVRERGRVLRHLRIDDIAGDCGGIRNDTLTVRLPRAKIGRNGSVAGHYVFADPGQPAGAVVSYFGHFEGNRFVFGRIFQDNDLDGETEATCEVAAASFTARLEN